MLGTLYRFAVDKIDVLEVTPLVTLISNFRSGPPPLSDLHYPPAGVTLKDLRRLISNQSVWMA